MGVIKKDILLPKPDQMVVPAYHGSMFGSPDVNNVNSFHPVGAATVYTATKSRFSSVLWHDHLNGCVHYTRQLHSRRPLRSAQITREDYQQCRNDTCIFVQPTGYAYAVCISPRHTRFHLRRDRGGTCTARPASTLRSPGTLPAIQYRRALRGRPACSDGTLRRTPCERLRSNSDELARTSTLVHSGTLDSPPTALPLRDFSHLKYTFQITMRDAILFGGTHRTRSLSTPRITKPAGGLGRTATGIGLSFGKRNPPTAHLSSCLTTTSRF
jgi:hypothetical protein